MQNDITIFDLDETLIATDSAMLWHQFLVAKKIVTEPNFLLEDQRLMGLYAIGKLDMPTYLQFCMAPLAKLSKENVDQLVEECVQSCILPCLYPQALNLLKKLHQADKKTIIISATMSFIVEKVARQLGVKSAMGIDMKIINGCYSDQIQGIATFREGKVKRLKIWLAENNKENSRLTFYTDSINDLAMCQFVNKAIVVNPCTRLLQQAQHNDWQQLTWSL
ncbi:MAG: HAD family hydrolase [Psychromonas sp.]